EGRDELHDGTTLHRRRYLDHDQSVDARQGHGARPPASVAAHEHRRAAALRELAPLLGADLADVGEDYHASQVAPAVALNVGERVAPAHRLAGEILTAHDARTVQQPLLQQPP